MIRININPILFARAELYGKLLYKIYREPNHMHAVTKARVSALVSTNQHVIMNMLRLPVLFLDELERGFPEFLANVKEDSMKTD